MITRITNADLKQLNSFGISAIADTLVQFDSTDDLREIFAQLGDTPWCVLSGGNNTLFTGEWHGTLLQPTMKQIGIVSDCADEVKVRAEAAVEWDDLVAWCVERELWGLENLSLIPGYVGAAPVQNIGAYGVEAKDCIESVEMYCVDNGKTLTLNASHCAFGYRDSVFKGQLRGKVIITAVNFTLTKTGTPKLHYGDLKNTVEQKGGATLKNIREAVIEIRTSKLPDPKVMGNAGSFFKNPVISEEQYRELQQKYPDIPSYPAHNGVKLAAGWLIDRAGWKGYDKGPAGVHAKQALVLVNIDKATGNDILQLAQRIVADIREKFGVTIEMEVNVL